MRLRPRRNRRSQGIRDMVAETMLSTKDLMYPMFVHQGSGSQPIESMPGQSRHDLDGLLRTVELGIGLGVNAYVLFPKVEESLKDSVASYSYAQDNYYLEVIRKVKDRFPGIVLMGDTAMDPYSSDGHDGIVENGRILNDPTLDVLAKMSVAQAQAGLDIVGPSDMMDGRVGVIRDALDSNGLEEVAIMSYCAKYASAYYGPFRDALGSAPKAGDKKTYQMDPANRREALREAALDEAEGADMLMVKPALSYLDVILELKRESVLPITAYNVSGEYAAVCAAAEKGWLDKDAVMMENLLSMKRAGADTILTYYALDAARQMG